MNDQIKAEVLKWLQSIGEAAKAGYDFVLQQAPLVVQEKILYARVEQTIYIGIAAALLGVGITLIVKSFQHIVAANLRAEAGTQPGYRQPDWKDSDWAKLWTRFLPGVGCTVIGVCVFGANIHEFVLTWFAPRVYIIQWIMGGLK